MAMIVDALLDLLVAQGADALVLEPDRAPVLQRASGNQPLSMPGMAPEMLVDVLTGVTTEAQREELARGGSLRTEYVTANGTAYAVLVERHGRAHRFTFRRHGTEPAATSRARATVPAAEPTPRLRAPSPLPEPEHRGVPTVVPIASEPTPIDTLVDAAPRDDVLDHLLQRARVEDASDIIVSTGVDARLRVGGELVQIGGTAVAPEQLLAFLGPVWDERARAALEATGSADLAFVHMGSRYRINVFRQIGGLAAA